MSLDQRQARYDDLQPELRKELDRHLDHAFKTSAAHGVEDSTLRHIKGRVEQAFATKGREVRRLVEALEAKQLDALVHMEDRHWEQVYRESMMSLAKRAYLIDGKDEISTPEEVAELFSRALVVFEGMDPASAVAESATLQGEGLKVSDGMLASWLDIEGRCIGPNRVAYIEKMRADKLTKKDYVFLVRHAIEASKRPAANPRRDPTLIMFSYMQPEQKQRFASYLIEDGNPESLDVLVAMVAGGYLDKTVALHELEVQMKADGIRPREKASEAYEARQKAQWEREVRGTYEREEAKMAGKAAEFAKEMEDAGESRAQRAKQRKWQFMDKSRMVSGDKREAALLARSEKWAGREASAGDKQVTSLIQQAQEWEGRATARAQLAVSKGRKRADQYDRRHELQLAYARLTGEEMDEMIAQTAQLKNQTLEMLERQWGTSSTAKKALTLGGAGTVAAGIWGLAMMGVNGVASMGSWEEFSSLPTNPMFWTGALAFGGAVAATDHATGTIPISPQRVGAALMTDEHERTDEERLKEKRKPVRAAMNADPYATRFAYENLPWLAVRWKSAQRGEVKDSEAEPFPKVSDSIRRGKSQAQFEADVMDFVGDVVGVVASLHADAGKVSIREMARMVNDIRENDMGLEAYPPLEIPDTYTV